MTTPRPERDGVYLAIADGPARPDRDHYAAACLASGLRQLGVPVFANVPFPGAQLRGHERIGPSVYVFVVTDQAYSPALMDEVASFPGRHKLILGAGDRASEMLTPPAVPALLAHESRLRILPGRRHPWAFGLSAEILAATAEALPFPERQPVLLRNFRPSLNQAVRNALDLALLPHLERHFTVDRDVDFSNHHERLKRHLGCLAYGGAMDEDLLVNDYFQRDPAKRALYQQITFREPTVIIRWDSWRWWESLAAGCLTFHLDFERYGLALPVMPRAWEHYIPVDLADPRGTVDRLMGERSRWADIAAAGRDWARAHYSPEAVARRLLDHIASVDFWSSTRL